MARKIITISISPDLHAFIKQRTDGLGLTSTSEYFRSLIRLDQRQVREEIRQERRRLEFEQLEYQHHSRRRY
jgi:Arc/MetJ-type ribon-helix-helix transcriptional regulator